MACSAITKATLWVRERLVLADGSLAEIVVWRVPRQIPPGSHGFKYRLAYVVGGKRMLGYDNERGKGDHRHIGEHEAAFVFTSIDDLLARFVTEVEASTRRR